MLASTLFGTLLTVVIRWTFLIAVFACPASAAFAFAIERIAGTTIFAGAFLGAMATPVARWTG